MNWTKKGLVYVPDQRMTWAAHSALTPTPILLNKDTIRIYAGFRDEKGVSRIGYVDVDSKDPLKILRVSEKPALDIGKKGCFDDNGVILGDIVSVDGKLHMYYVGFQLVDQVKFLAFTGLAVSHDGGETFERLSDAPVMDRSDEGLYFRAIHSVTIEEGVWKCWYGVGSKWSQINGTMYPNYVVRYIESKDGVSFGKEGTVCIEQENDEYRIGRPRVVKESGMYKMYYTVGTLRGTYLPGYAESLDGKTWVRKDAMVGIAPSTSGWDSTSLSYTAPINTEYGQYIFYNGNNMGLTGFGCAVLD